MKKLLALSLVISTLAACGPANQDYTKRLKDLEEKTQRDIEDIKTNPEIMKEVDEAMKIVMDAEGAQAGLLTVEGVLVARQGNKFILDYRIKAESIGGKRSDGSMATATKPVLSDLATGSKDDLVAEKYINLGCTDLNAADTENLEEVEASFQAKENPLVISAKKVFICGTQQAASNNVTISAKELILRDADISLSVAGKLQDLQGSLNFTTNTLVLQGENKITALGQDMEAPIPDGAALQMTVREEIRGSGHLALKTVGGNVTKAIEKAD